MISLLEIAKSINEADVDDDKIIKYKDKEGESQEMTAGAAKRQPDDHPAKVAYNKMADKGDDDSEKDVGGKLGGSDFDRDGDDEEKSTESENEKIIGALEDMDLDGLNVDSLDSAIDSGQYASITGKDDDPDNEMSVNAFQDGDSVGYAINVGIGHDTIYFDRKEEALESAQKLFKDDKIRKAMDGEGEETLADLGDYAKSIVKSKDETINVNLKEKYDRIFRSLK